MSLRDRGKRWQGGRKSPDRRIRKVLAARPGKRRARRGLVFADLGGMPLDLAMPPPYDLSPQRQDDARAEVERLIDELAPGAVDAGSRTVLNNLINAWADEELAELDAERDDRRAISAVLLGIAAEELARRTPLHDADVAAAAHTRTALADLFRKLTGRAADELVVAAPGRAREPATSTVLPISLADRTAARGQRDERSDDDR